eukprot:scaffold39499_cov17-Prasinocladus_malaysianus.AAC.2
MHVINRRQTKYKYKGVLTDVCGYAGYLVVRQRQGDKVLVGGNGAADSLDPEEQQGRPELSGCLSAPVAVVSPLNTY